MSNWITESNWITDRLPTAEDCPHYGEVWLMLSGCPEVLRGHWSEVKLNNPWQPVICPAPYVKPKRWTVKWEDQLQCWHLMDKLSKFNTGLNWGRLPALNHEQGNIAKQIEDIFNKELP